MLTVLTWYWRQPGGRTVYGPDHVAIWADMVRRHLSMPHRIACVTDCPEGLPSHIEIITPPRDFEDVRIPTWGEARPQCLRRLAMFRPDAAEIFGPRFVCMDLDCVIGAALDPMLDVADEFRICSGTAMERPYNGSMMILTAGARPRVHAEFTPKRAAEAGRRFVGSDQAWISHILGPDEAVWSIDDGLAWYGMHRRASTPQRVMFFPGHTKPWMIATAGAHGWISSNYRRRERGRCLVLGYERTLWDDVAAAIEDGPYDAVIASPEAAEHWPGAILAIARDTLEAMLIANMHGYDDVTWCGVSRRASLPIGRPPSLRFAGTQAVAA